MSKAQVARNFKKNLFASKLRFHGLTLESLGKQMAPPVSRSRVQRIVHGADPDYRLKEIAAILKTNVQTLWPKEKEVV